MQTKGEAKRNEMVYALELTAEEMRQMERAERAGVPVRTLLQTSVHEVIARLPQWIPLPAEAGNALAPIHEPRPTPPPNEEQTTRILRFAAERLEQAQRATDEEQVQATRELDELAAALHRNRYPELYSAPGTPLNAPDGSGWGETGA